MVRRKSAGSRAVRERVDQPTDFPHLLPPLATSEFEALRADIKANGIRDPVIVDEEGVVLDGNHRLKIDPAAPRRVVKGLSPGEKEAFVFRCNFVRRNLSPDQKREANRRMKETAAKLRAEDARKWTQKAIAGALGVAQPTVNSWFEDRSNISPDNASKQAPDARVKVNPKLKPVIAERVKAGETQAQVAADYGISQRQVSTYVKGEAKKDAEEKKYAAAAAAAPGDCGVVHGDFREAGKSIPDGSVNMIFTDPPYDEASIGLYGDLADFASRVLMEGGWLLTYAGQNHLPRTIQALLAPGLVYAWTFCVLHSGGDQRFRLLRIHNGWKPVLGFYKPPLKASEEWFKDVVSGGQEKSLHKWQQPEAEATHFISRMSKAQGIICDPFCGSGTTLKAAKDCGRRWLGFETDKKHVMTARGRLA